LAQSRSRRIEWRGSTQRRHSCRRALHLLKLRPVCGYTGRRCNCRHQASDTLESCSYAKEADPNVTLLPSFSVGSPSDRRSARASSETDDRGRKTRTTEAECRAALIRKRVRIASGERHQCAPGRFEPCRSAALGPEQQLTSVQPARLSLSDELRNRRKHARHPPKSRRRLHVLTRTQTGKIRSDHHHVRSYASQ
jgi:hypothetical protein